MLFGVHHLTSCLDGTLMSIGRSSSSHAYLQTFHNSHRPLLILSGCQISMHVIVILIRINQRNRSSGTLLNAPLHLLDGHFEE